MALSSVSGVGPKTVRMLVSRFGSPDKIFSASAVEIAGMPRLDLPLAHKIIGAGKRVAEFQKLITRLSKDGLNVLCPDSCEYPELLKLTEDFPPILYGKGTELPGGEDTVAIVGTRSPAASGVEAAEKMAEWLAGRGITVVSGLARGIDAAAHKGALKAGGKTVAVLGSGLRMVYPRENCGLADEICVNGAVISECHPNEVVSGQRLIQRNRVISGLSLGVILVEPRRGALNTAEWALKQHRHIFIYEPGNNSVLPAHLLDAAHSICGIDEMDDVVDRLKISAVRGSEMPLFQIGWRK